jgi:phosphonate dehydrogenase
VSRSRPKIVVTHWVHPEVVAYLSTFGTAEAPGRVELAWSRAEVLARARDADALITSMADTVDEELLDGCPRLRVVGATLKGYDNHDVDACTRHGVWLTHLPDLLTAPTSELALALALGLMRHVRAGDELVRTGRFEGWRPVLYGASLHGATVGIVGMGRLGAAVAHRVAAFGPARIVYHDTRRAPPDRVGAERVGLDDLLAAADLVLLLLPLTPATRHLINADTLRLVRPGAYLVNIGRGSVVDEPAVLAALERGQLGGYASDVFELEDRWLPDHRPCLPDALRTHPRTLFTPHLGSAVDSVRRDMSLATAREVRRVLAGQAPEHPVNRPHGTG